MDIEIKNATLNEIAVECGLHIAEHNPEVTAQEVTFYAEKIVEECIKVILEQRNPANLNYKPTEQIAQAVREHFKVA